MSLSGRRSPDVSHPPQAGIPLYWTGIAFFLAVVAYAPAFNNGFISDDIVILGRLRESAFDLHHLSLPVEGIRLTTYAAFAVLLKLFGYRPGFYYGFNLMLHLANICILGRLLLDLTGRRSLAITGIVLFATMQNPQEAVMWISAMGDGLVTGFILAALLLWVRGRFAGCIAFYCLASISKESSPVLLVLIPLCDWIRSGKLELRRQHFWLLVPAAGFVILFVAQLRSNMYLNSGLYAFRPAGFLITLNSAHRMAFPWLSLVLLCLYPTRWRFDYRWAAGFALWISASLAPYSFITYQNHVPSRSQYLAATGLAALAGLEVEDGSKTGRSNHTAVQ